MEKYEGLTAEDVEEKIRKGQVNGNFETVTKSYKEIFQSNIFTFFNFLNISLAVCVALVHSYRNMLFLGVVFWNMFIGIVQEIRAKCILDKMAILMKSKVEVWREGKKTQISTEDIVVDDIIVLKEGEQVHVDAKVLSGKCEADESMLTGESDPIDKKAGDTLLSGSYIISGEIAARVCAVGEDSYANQIIKQAKKHKKSKSEIRDSIDRIIKIISMVVLPLGAIMFLKQRFYFQLPMEQAVTKTVASMISMIPDGLVLLSSVVMAVSVVKLAKEKAIVQELFCIENLARVDVLCLDKTGTITEGEMELEEEIPIVSDYKEAVCGYFTAMAGENATALAIRKVFDRKVIWKVKKMVTFSSERKWGAVSFVDKGTYVLGAPEVVLGDAYDEYEKIIEKAIHKGRRVVAFVRMDGEITEDLGKCYPCALFVLKDRIRKNAQDTFAYFQKQGVEIKIISGDHPETVMQIGKRAGVKNAQSYVDARTLTTKEQLEAAANKYTVFGRVTPEQKCELVQALQRQGHTVAMTGDGINDVLALKEADCSIVMDSGCDVARKTAKVVLLQSDFSIMPKILAEGRRAINNLERSASLFLTKTTFATLVVLLFLVIKVVYPLQPIQFTLISGVTIGTPAFLLALEPNYSVVKGTFLKKVFGRAIPAGCLAVANIGVVVAVAHYLGYGDRMISTMTTIAAATANFVLLFHLCKPWNKKRMCVYAGLIVIFGFAVCFGGSFFGLGRLTRMGQRILVIMILANVGVYSVAQLIKMKRGEKKGKGRRYE